MGTSVTTLIQKIESANSIFVKWNETDLWSEISFTVIFFKKLSLWMMIVIIHVNLSITGG